MTMPFWTILENSARHVLHSGADDGLDDFHNDEIVRARAGNSRVQVGSCFLKWLAHWVFIGEADTNTDRPPASKTGRPSSAKASFILSMLRRRAGGIVQLLELLLDLIKLVQDGENAFRNRCSNFHTLLAIRLA